MSTEYWTRMQGVSGGSR